MKYSSCRKCPYFMESNEDSYTLIFCRAKKQADNNPYSQTINDLSHWNCGEKVPSECPRKNITKVFIPLDYIVGHLRYGHIEAELTNEALERFQKGEDLSLDDLNNSEIIIDGYEIDSYGDIDWDNLEVLEGDI